MRNWKVYSGSSSSLQKEIGFSMKGINKQDPAFREKLTGLERLSRSRSYLFSQVFKLLSETIKTGDYKLLGCSYLDSMNPNFDAPQREFRFSFVYEPEDSGETN